MQQCALRISFFLVYAATSAMAQPTGISTDVNKSPQPVLQNPVICEVNGSPLFQSDIDWLRARRFGKAKAIKPSIHLNRALALSVVRRHLALKTLRARRGASLTAKIDRSIAAAEQNALRIGKSLQQQAQTMGADADAIRRDLTWQVAWADYLREQLTPAKLRDYFTSHCAEYDGTRVKLSQIFVAADSSNKADRFTDLERLRDRLRLSKDLPAAFAQAASPHSKTGPQQTRGLVGWVDSQDDLPITLFNAAVSSAPGTLTGPLPTALGVHLLYIHEKQEGHGTFDGLTDLSPLRRDLVNEIFATLVRQQADVHVRWIRQEYQPPPGTPVIP